jgi:chromosome segregation ATPase
VVEPTNISELFRALVYLKDFADGRLRNLRSRKYELEERHRNLQAQIANNSDVGASLYREASLIEADVQQSYRQTRETEERLASQNSVLNQLTAITKQMSNEVASAKDEMFATLYDAARRHNLLSPSNYRTLPKPLSPVYSQNGSSSLATAVNPITVTPIYAAAALAPAQAIRVTPMIVPLRAQAIRLTPISEADVQQKLNEINSSLPQINRAYEDINEAFRRVNSLEPWGSRASGLNLYAHRIVMRPAR